MQLQGELGYSNADLIVEAEEVQRMRLAFAGIHVSPRRNEFYRVHFASGQAMMTDGNRLHTIPVRYPTSVGADVPLDVVQHAWARNGGVQVEPGSQAQSFIDWRDFVPKADVGILCDIDVWLPALGSIRGWGWSKFSFFKHETLMQPVSAARPTMSLNLSHLMYKGKNLPEVEKRTFNPQYLYDVFRNAHELGDSRVFLCLLSQNPGAPLLCRGNQSSFLALVLPRK